MRCCGIWSRPKWARGYAQRLVHTQRQHRPSASLDLGQETPECPSVTAPKSPVTFPKSSATMPKSPVTLFRNTHLRPGPHVDGLHSQPQGVDADHFEPMHCSSQQAHSGAALTGQLTAIVAEPRRHSIRMSAAGVVNACPLVTGAATVVAGSVNAMNSAPAATALRTGRAAPCVGEPHPRRHLCTRLAFSPCACATAATDAPASAHAANTRAFNSSACRRLGAPVPVCMVSTSEIGGHLHRRFVVNQDGMAGRLRGISAFSRLPQTRSAASHSIVSACRTASS